MRVGDTTKRRVYRTTVALNSIPIEVDIIDAKAAPFEIPECDAMIVVFSTASQATYGFVQRHLPRLFRRGRPIVLVGTKTDVDPPEVGYEDESNLAKLVQAGYFHTTINNAQKVNELFNFAFQRHMHARPPSKTHGPLGREAHFPLFRCFTWSRVNFVCGLRQGFLVRLTHSLEGMTRLIEVCSVACILRASLMRYALVGRGTVDPANYNSLPIHPDLKFFVISRLLLFQQRRKTFERSPCPYLRAKR